MNNIQLMDRNYTVAEDLPDILSVMQALDKKLKIYSSKTTRLLYSLMFDVGCSNISFISVLTNQH